LGNESLGGSETMAVVWMQMLDGRTEGRTNGRKRTGKKLKGRIMWIIIINLH
jgi:hypothetical protein